MVSVIIHSAPVLADTISAYMTGKGWATLSPAHDRDLVQLALEEGPGAVILDADVPDRGRNVWDVLKRLREHSDVPLIIIAGRASERDAVKALGLGADDYVRKPFGLEELEARLHSARKRLPPDRGGNGDLDVLYDDGVLRVELTCQRIYLRCQEVHLSPTEFRLLAYLINHRNRVVPHEELLEQVWGPSYADGRGCVTLYVRYLRTILEDDPSHPRYIRTKRGTGYRFIPPSRSNRS